MSLGISDPGSFACSARKVGVLLSEPNRMPRQSKKADDLGELLKILSHPHRRRIVTRLHERNPRDEDELELEELAGSDEFDTETLMLIHSHLPKLAGAGFINWNQEQQIVTRGARFEEIAPLIDLMIAHQDELPANWL